MNPVPFSRDVTHYCLGYRARGSEVYTTLSGRQARLFIEKRSSLLSEQNGNGEADDDDPDDDVAAVAATDDDDYDDNV